MITRKTRNGIVALVVLTSVSFWLSQRQDETKQDPVSDLDTRLNYVLRDFELQFFDANGQPTMNLKAPVLRNDPKLEIGTIENPVMKLYQADIIWNINADLATVTNDKEHVELLGAVHVRRQETASENWVTLDTREVKIDVTPQIATTDEAVTMTDGMNQLNATGMVLDMLSDTLLLKQQVKAIYAVN